MGNSSKKLRNYLPDALTHQLDEPSKFVRLYALVGNLRLCASAEVVVKAEEAMHLIFETYNRPT